MRELKRYESIIDLPHHVSKSHPRMARMDRAAQFSSFAALTGHEEAIEQTADRNELAYENEIEKNPCEE